MERIAMREVGRTDGQGISRRVRKIVIQALLVPGLSAIGVVFLLNVLDHSFWIYLFDSRLELSDRLILTAAPFVSLCFVASCVARGIRATFSAGMIQLTGIYGGTSLVLLIYHAAFGAPSSTELTAVFLVLVIVCFTVSIAWLFSRAELKPVESEDHLQNSWSGIGFFYAITLLSFGLSGADVIAVSILMDRETTALYAVAAKLAFSLNIGLTGINSILFATAARSYYSGSTEELMASVTKAANWSAGVALCLAIAIGLGSTFVLSVFGDAYLGAAILLEILLLANVFNASVGGVSVLMQMSGLERTGAKILAVSLLLMLLMFYLLVPNYGLVGAGLATSVMLTVTPALMAVSVRMNLGFWPVPIHAGRILFWWIMLAGAFWLRSLLDVAPLVWVALGLTAAIIALVHTTGIYRVSDIQRELRAQE